MIGARRSVAMNRLVTPVLALVLATASIVATAPPVAAAAHAVPWRFTQVTLDSSISGYSGAEPLKGWVLQCPAGYTAVSGGIAGGDATSQIWRMLEYPNPADGTYHILARNVAGSGTTVKLVANCVWLDDVGAITTVTAEFPRNGSGRAGGILRCPVGTTVFSGGVDWSNTSQGKRIDFTSPITDGTTRGTGWYVAGYSDVPGVLGIELRCVDSSLLDAEYATAGDSTDASPNYTTANALCAAGYRLLTGGAAPAGTKSPGVDQGWASMSGPFDYRQWPVNGFQKTGVVLRALALCVPASTASATYTQKPPALSTSSSGSVTFSGSDSAGETLSYTCYVDSTIRVCSAGVPVSYGPLQDGSHQFYMAVTNQSGSHQGYPYTWTIDATAPLVSGHTPASSASVAGPFTIDFSEAVQGVSTSSVIVHAESANVDVAGTVARPSTTTATWTPKALLVPGETYRVSLTSAIHDTAGNPLTATYFNVRTATIVENNSSTLQRSWDVDNMSVASGGGYILSRLSGTRADLTFTATAGQTVSVYGIRRPDGGYADIYVDGVKKATASFYAATVARARVYLSGALTAGTHSISIRPLGTKPAASSNAWVSIDTVNVGATVRQESALKQTFRTTSSASAYGGSYDTMIQSSATDTTPARVQLTLVGTGVKVYATKSPVSGKARIWVDGVVKATVNLYATSTVYKALAYSGTFALGKHVVRIEAVGTTNSVNSAVNLDRITIN
jgi:hypothetical protein